MSGKVSINELLDQLHDAKDRGLIEDYIQITTVTYNNFIFHNHISITLISNTNEKTKQKLLRHIRYTYDNLLYVGFSQENVLRIEYETQENAI